MLLLRLRFCARRAFYRDTGCALFLLSRALSGGLDDVFRGWEGLLGFWGGSGVLGIGNEFRRVEDYCVYTGFVMGLNSTSNLIEAKIQIIVELHL